jgi:hypothetical protein
MNNKKNSRSAVSNENKSVADEVAVDPDLLDIISSVIDDNDGYESNMVAAVDVKLPDGVKRVIKTGKGITIKKQQLTREVAPILVNYINENDPHDLIYNSGQVFDSRLINDFEAEIRKLTNERIHPTVFVKICSRLHFTQIINKITNPNAKRKLPHVLGHIFFSGRVLNDLRVKTYNVKQEIEKEGVSDSQIELQIFGLLAHLNNIIYEVE